MYTEIVSATLVGYVFFHEIPNIATWAGIAIIVGAGLLLLVRRKTPLPLAAPG
jgi:LPXTG-motif cell wall-anchored protein